MVGAAPPCVDSQSVLWAVQTCPWQTSTDDELVARSLGELGWSLYAGDAYLARRSAPADPNDLSGHEIVALDTDWSASAAAKWLEKHAANAAYEDQRVGMPGQRVGAAGGGADAAAQPGRARTLDRRASAAAHHHQMAAEAARSQRRIGVCLTGARRCCRTRCRRLAASARVRPTMPGPWARRRRDARCFSSSCR